MILKIIFYSYVAFRGYLSEDDIRNNKKEDELLFRKLILMNDLVTKVKSPAAIICTALRKLIERNYLQIIPIADTYEIKDFTNVLIDNGDFLNVLPDTLWVAYASYCREIRRDIIYKSGRELYDPLKKEDAIMVRDETVSKRSTHKIKAKTEKRFLYIRKSKFYEFCSVFDEF